jgi:hypothetical protein
MFDAVVASLSDLNSVVEMYVQSRVRAGRPVSTTEAVLAIRTVLPDCELDDQELANLIAASAVKAGQPVAFDLWTAA